jgi:hypothetical protein
VSICEIWCDETWRLWSELLDTAPDEIIRDYGDSS